MRMHRRRGGSCRRNIQAKVPSNGKGRHKGTGEKGWRRRRRKKGGADKVRHIRGVRR